MPRLTCLVFGSLLLAACGAQVHEMPASAGKYDLGDKVLASVDAANAAQPGAAIPAAPPKKIIYNAKLELRVDDFAAAEKHVVKLVREANGYVAEFRESRHEGKRSAGEWVTRIPVDSFDAFLGKLDNIGVPEHKQIDSREVTEEFVDLKARLASKQKVEQRVAELMEKRAGDVRDLIAMETELGRVREEVERIEGRLRYLSDRTEMTTVTISIRETQSFVPEPTTLAGRIAATFNDSLARLAFVGESVLLFVVAFAPWAVVAIVVAVPIGVGLKRRGRRQPRAA